MAKVKDLFVCNNCGQDFNRWQGQCGNCKEWNTLNLFKVDKSAVNLNLSKDIKDISVKKINTTEIENIKRRHTSFSQLDYVLGNGMVEGSAILIGGSPGAGKSTLLLQVANHIALQNSVLYIHAEESLNQIALRAKRLGLADTNIEFANLVKLEEIEFVLEKYQPNLLIIDSIQMVYSESISGSVGSISQVQNSTLKIIHQCKQKNITLLIIGHVTKEGNIAGPKTLEHYVDTSLMLEITEDNRYRSIKASKNRFGAVNEIAIFAMQENGMKEIKNPSAIFLGKNLAAQNPGSVTTTIWEGSRAILLEIQALVDKIEHNYAKRVAMGLELTKLNLLLAVLHKASNHSFSQYDVFVNLVGGIKTQDTSVDLAQLIAIYSSFKNAYISESIVIFGEVGLTGEIRPVPNGEARVKAAMKHNFKNIMLPQANKTNIESKEHNLISVKNVSQALDWFNQNATKIY